MQQPLKLKMIITIFASCRSFDMFLHSLLLYVSLLLNFVVEGFLKLWFRIRYLQVKQHPTPPQSWFYHMYTIISRQLLCVLGMGTLLILDPGCNAPLGPKEGWKQGSLMGKYGPRKPKTPAGEGRGVGGKVRYKSSSGNHSHHYQYCTSSCVQYIYLCHHVLLFVCWFSIVQNSL